MTRNAVVRVFCQKRAQFDFRGGGRSGENRRIDALPRTAKLLLAGVIVRSFTPQFVDLERLGKSLRADPIDAAEAKSIAARVA